MNPVPSSAPIQPRSHFLPRIHASDTRHRGLLALDGGRVTPQILSAAETRCIQLADRVDILLLNSPRAPITLLRRLLVRLEQANIDYRLTCSTGNMGDQIASYLRHFVGINFILVDALPDYETGGEINFYDLCRQGYRIITLTDMGRQNSQQAG